MGAIDWNLLTPRNSEAPSRELASITGLLSAFADRRDKMAAEQAARQQAEAHFQTQMQEKYADNARDEQLRKEQYQVTRDQMAAAQQQREQARQEKLDEERRKATPGIYSALQNQNPDLARVTAESYGGRLEPYQAPHVQAIDEKPQLSSPTFANGNADAQRAQDDMSAVDNFHDTRAADTENARRDQATKGIYGLSFPGTMETFMSDLADQRARLARGQQGAGVVDEFAKTYGDSPIAKQVIQEIRGAVASGALPPEKEAIYKATAQRRHELEQMENASKNAAINAGNKNDAGNVRDLNLLERQWTNFERSVQWGGLVTGGRQLNAAVANIAKPSALQHRDAQIQLGRYFRGGTPTEGEMKLLYDNLGGKLGQALPQFIAQMESGDLTPSQLAMLKESARTAQGELHKNVNDVLDAARIQFGPGSGNEYLAPQVNAKIRARFKALGIDVPEVFPGATGGVQAGSGKRGKVTRAPSSGNSVDELDAAADDLLGQIPGGGE